MVRGARCRLTSETATPARLLVRAKSGSMGETAAWATKQQPAGCCRPKSGAVLGGGAYGACVRYLAITFT